MRSLTRATALVMSAWICAPIAVAAPAAAGTARAARHVDAAVATRHDPGATAAVAMPALPVGDGPRDSGNLKNSSNYRGTGRPVNSGNYSNITGSTHSNNTKVGSGNFANGSQCVVIRKRAAKRGCR
ncbi:hypothetical protein [Microtetraspora sp. NBRC 13810]|uniref:hypothetical protein n=1 Tax=Microtetraspora sp. NBRC 13810 TaxID=3030990 RepID=UPI002553F339|nr:hypothetical protein [Microtetraspora sp. NBRC 13810]